MNIKDTHSLCLFFSREYCLCKTVLFGFYYLFMIIELRFTKAKQSTLSFTIFVDFTKECINSY